MAKILDVLIGVIGILYICGQITYYGIVHLLSIMGVMHANVVADSHKIIFDWIIFMAFILVILGCIALVVNCMAFRDNYFWLRLVFNLVCLFMPFLHFENPITIVFECIFLILFGLYLAVLRKAKGVSSTNG